MTLYSFEVNGFYIGRLETVSIATRVIPLCMVPWWELIIEITIKLFLDFNPDAFYYILFLGTFQELFIIFSTFYSELYVIQ